MLASTSAIADILQLRGETGWLSPPLVPIHRTAAVRGTARTVRLAPGPGPEGLNPLHRLLDGRLSGRIVVVAGAEAAAGAVWGRSSPSPPSGPVRLAPWSKARSATSPPSPSSASRSGRSARPPSGPGPTSTSP
ncbi:hypothetical protein [Rhizohabitans arisaemae]|uniref:hypothetical protein n=1 Tax=Rhizohabitans arisaemae TaxID=2720610 RepID=UPI0024B0C77D|nr:hypothetical protein [Rhizohabitans arisaemae]